MTAPAIMTLVNLYDWHVQPLIQRRGYPAPTSLVHASDLFGLPVPTSPTMSCRTYAGGLPSVNDIAAKEKEDDSKPLKEKMSRRVNDPHTQFAKSAKLQQAIQVKLTHHIYVLTEISAA